MSDTANIVQDQHAQIGVLRQTHQQAEHSKHPEAQWFAGAGLGVFLHWGISAVNGDGDLSWAMMKRAPGHAASMSEKYGPFAVQRVVTPHEYWQQAERFRAEAYNPDAWMAALGQAGVRYAVLTTKHHDGYALWPSAYGDFNTGTHLGGRDLVGEFVAACRRHGIKIGFYYSPPDWWFDREVMSFHYGGAKPDLDIHHRPVEFSLTGAARAAHQRAHRDYVRGQTEELLTRYGAIDILWFDGSADNAISLDRIRALQPGIIVNRRGLGVGDFETPECAFPKERPAGWWEYCHIWNDGAWGYLKHETYKPLGWMTAELAKARAWGGNFLINMGADARGELPSTALRRLEQLGAWLELHQEAIFEVEPGPWPQQSNVPVTVRGETWYLHVSGTVDYPIEITGVACPRRLRRLASGAEIPFQYEDGRLTVDLPSGMPGVDGDVFSVVFGV